MAGDGPQNSVGVGLRLLKPVLRLCRWDSHRLRKGQRLKPGPRPMGVWR